MNKICPKNCYATDKNILICPRCGEKMRNTSMSQEQITKDTELRQKASHRELNGREFERINNSSIRDKQELLRKREINYNKYDKS